MITVTDLENYFSFDNNWTLESKKIFIDRILFLIPTFKDLLGEIILNIPWKIVLIDASTSGGINALTDSISKTLYISNNCPDFSLIHEFYHILHTTNDTFVDIFEEGLAIAVSVLICKKLNLHTHFDHEDFIISSNSLSKLPNDVVVPMDNFLPLLPIRYFYLGKFWLSQEEKFPGLLKQLHQLSITPSQNPREKFKFLLDAISNINVEVAGNLIKFWNLTIPSVSEVAHKFIIAFNNSNKSLHLISCLQRQVKLSHENWTGSGNIEQGSNRKIQLNITKINNSDKSNNPIIDIDPSGYVAFSLSNIPTLIGPADAYNIEAIDLTTNNVLDNLTINL